MSRILKVEFDKKQQGWGCGIYFGVTTAIEYSDVRKYVHEWAPWAALSFWRAWRKYRAMRKEMETTFGQRKAQGWTQEKPIE